ncbi:MAG: hypothetical protein ACI39U_05310 [Candidatus Cryptobacteroides sp.]
MWKLFIAVLVLVALCFIGLGFNIIFRKDGKFPETEISSNKQMKKLGIRCAKEEEMRLWSKKNGGRKPECSDLGCTDCAGCGLHKEQ